MEIGSRVVRGPDWMWEDQDEGEGNVGTVVQHGQDRNLPDGTVLVHWDSGRQANYRAGHSGKFDLRILDSAQAGVKHTFVTCDGCKQSPLAGTRWKCADCPNYDLCSPCFMNDVHNMHHSFLRFDISGGDGIPVGKRSNFTKQQSRGLFPGARVTRGRDWKWGDQDGGSGHVGQLTEITSWNGVERAGANVTWSLRSGSTYRTGHMGEVDLKCSTSAIGPPYYCECLAKLGENRRRLDSNRLRVGDRVSVCLDAEVLRAMSAGHGGWVDDMAECIGKVGKISKIDADGDVHISYGLMSWVFRPQAVTKVPSFQAGDKVRILRDKQLVQNLQQGHGGWNEKMTMALGKEGKILEVDSDGDAVVSVDSDLWLFNPAALEDMSAGGEATSSRGDTSPTSKVDPATDLLRMLLLEAATSKGGSVDPGDRLVNASSNGNLQEVREILEAHPGKIDHKRGGKTALHVACHQGRKEIVQYLLGKGADKDIKDEQDYSALHHAAYGDRSGETVTAMLNIGTNVNVSDDKNKSTPLHLAVNQGNDAGVRSLLASRHCDVNCQDLAGDTPLHDAISKGNNAIVELILGSERLEIFVCNSRGFNPLHQACLKGNLHAVQKIIEKYPDLIETPKEDGFTALHLAAFNNHLDIARCLLLSGHCDINLRNNKRQTALALSVSEAYTAMIELLVEHGADVNADDEDGDTPLHLAVIHQAVGTTGLRGLLQGLGLNLPAGAETDQHTGSAIAVYLVLHGANVSLCNHEGKTPLDLCQDTQTAALIQQVARNAPSSVPRPPTTLTTGPSSSKPPVPPRPSTARLASGAAVQRQKKTQDTANRAEAAGTDCIICSENVATVTFKPCGHKVTCSVCSMKLKRCLKCNAAIQQKTSPEGAPVSTSTLMDETDYAERIRLLKSKLQAMARIDAFSCQICMERDQNMVFSCGDGACKECSERLENCHICGQTIESVSPTVPTEIIARGSRAKRAYLNALKTGKVKVYRARIMLIGQDRVGKTSLKKSFLGLPFDSEEESTDGIEVDPSKFEVNTDQVKNWKRTDEKFGVSQVAPNLAKRVARHLQEIGDEGDERKRDKENEVEEKREINLKQASFDAAEELQGQETNVKPLMEEKPSSFKTEVDQGTSGESDVREETDPAVLTDLKIDPSLPPKEFTDHLVQLLGSLNLENETTTVEHPMTLDLWDFAGQHLYYASYPVFLSTRAVYILVYDLSRKLNDTANPCFKHGIDKTHLSNPNKETNLENFLSWLVSLRTMCSLKPDVNDSKTNVGDLSYCRPPVFIVGTHADKPCQDIKEVESQIQQEISVKEYAVHVIRPFFTVDNTQGSADEGVAALQKQIIEVLKQEPYMGEEVPIRWFNFEKVVKALTAKKLYYLHLEQLHGIIQRVCFIEDEDEAATMLDFYHDLGMIVRHRNTVVLQAQWLIEVFRQLITIRSFNEMEPRHSKLWKEMERTGALRMELVDHVFSKCCQQQGLIKEDILDMMEQFGLIVKFIPSPTNEMYFVPCQLKTPPKALCGIEPSPSDPCPLYLHFLGGFVPHGFFGQLVSRITKWCSKSGFGQPPKFFLAASRFVIKKKSTHQLTLLCKKRFVKVILTHSQPDCGASFEAKEVAILVRTILEETVRDLRRELPWLSNLTCDFCVVCPGCQQEEEKCSNHDAVSCDHEDCLFFLNILDEGQLSDCPNDFCSKEKTVEGLEKWFAGKAVRPGHHPSTDDDYNMTAHPRGITLIINNTSFTPHPEHGQQSPRHGSEEDVRQVEELFTALGFAVQRGQNLSRAKLLEKLHRVLSGQDPSGYDCFVLWLMSHGRSGEVFCSDGNTIPIQALHDMIAGCVKLSGKPKLFFIQACRGDNEDEGVAACSDLSPNHVDSPCDSVKNPASREPTHADFLYAFSTVDEYVSYRNRNLGSHYVRGLVEAFRERAVYDHLLDILTVVNKKVSNMEVKRPSGENKNEIKIYKQMPEVKHTLRKKVRF